MAVDTATRCAFTDCHRLMPHPEAGRLVGHGHRMWLCPDHEDASWTPSGFAMPSAWRRAIDRRGRQRRPRPWSHDRDPG